jgi:hypothetical protein
MLTTSLQEELVTTELAVVERLFMGLLCDNPLLYFLFDRRVLNAPPDMSHHIVFWVLYGR